MDSEGIGAGKDAALAAGTMLRGGMYVITRILGRGGFGITYLAEHVGLGKRVAIKEFFFGQFCERDENTSHVTVPTVGNRELVERFRLKFVKEARLIGSKLSHPSIVNVSDVFDENGTSYYVMDYIDGLSLSDVIKKRGRIGEVEAVDIIDHVGEALAYVHSQNINHLDIKPGNIMMENGDGRVVLIDFGVAKQYDASTGEATTTTPVGRSHGYSPLEQYKVGGVSQFSPESDIYALGATLYKMLTGKTPPEAGDVAQDGLPPLPSNISVPVRQAIAAAMQTVKKNRPHSVADFLKLLHGSAAMAEKEAEATVVGGEQGGNAVENHVEYDDNEEEEDGRRRRWLFWVIGAAVAAGAFVVLQLRPWQTPAAVEAVADTVAVASDLDSAVVSVTEKLNSSVASAGRQQYSTSQPTRPAWQQPERRAKPERQQANREQEPVASSSTAQQHSQQLEQEVSEPSVQRPDEVFRSVEQMPSFPGGDAALIKYLSYHINYPPMAMKNNIQGRVVVQFVVTKTGKVGEVKVVRGVDRDLDNEAVRVVRSLPDFIPGNMNGEPVNVWFTLPVTFKLQGVGDEKKDKK